MNSQTDQQLLREHAGRQWEAAFAELMRRHVDFVYSAALRMVRDAHLAEDVTQGVFIALAKNARQLAEYNVLSGWLHRTTQNLAANVVRSEVRRRIREQEAVSTANNNGVPSSLSQMEPYIITSDQKKAYNDYNALLEKIQINYPWFHYPFAPF